MTIWGWLGVLLGVLLCLRWWLRSRREHKRLNTLDGTYRRMDKGSSL